MSLMTKDIQQTPAKRRNTELEVREVERDDCEGEEPSGQRGQYYP